MEPLLPPDREEDNNSAAVCSEYSVAHRVAPATQQAKVKLRLEITRSIFLFVFFATSENWEAGTVKWVINHRDVYWADFPVIVWTLWCSLCGAV